METPEQSDPPRLITETEHLRIYLHDRDVACPLCGYNLRDQVAGRCPECGRELRLSVGLTEPFLRAWIALAFVTFGVAGIGLLFVFALIKDRWPPVNGIASIAFLIVLASPASAVIVTVQRRRFIRLSQEIQWVVAAGAFVFYLTAIVIFFVNVR